jgi:hypothetical protein
MSELRRAGELHAGLRYQLSPRARGGLYRGATWAVTIASFASAGSERTRHPRRVVRTRERGELARVDALVWSGEPFWLVVAGGDRFVVCAGTTTGAWTQAGGGP